MPRQGRYSFPRRLIHFAALGFGAGKVPVAPGTFGTLVAVPIYLSLRETGIVAYALFRLFDIAKPFPIRVADRRVRGGFGVMLDDLLAGVYAWIVLNVAVVL